MWGEGCSGGQIQFMAQPGVGPPHWVWPSPQESRGLWHSKARDSGVQRTQALLNSKQNCTQRTRVIRGGLERAPPGFKGPPPSEGRSPPRVGAHLVNAGRASWGERTLSCRETESQHKPSDFTHKNHNCLPSDQVPGARWSPPHHPEVPQPGVKSSALAASPELCWALMGMLSGLSVAEFPHLSNVYQDSAYLRGLR